MSYCYKVLNKYGKYEPWSGKFKTEEEADKWYKRHGVFHEARGYTLKKFEGGSED